MHNMGVLVRHPNGQPHITLSTKCPTCGCKWGYHDVDPDAIKCGQCNRVLRYK